MTIRPEDEAAANRCQPWPEADEAEGLIITLRRQLSCEHVVTLFFDDYLDASQAHRMIELSDDLPETKALAEKQISESYGP